MNNATQPPSFAPGAPIRANTRFMLSHPLHALALGFGTGLSPKAPGTAATLGAWISYAALSAYLSRTTMAWCLVAALALGWWSSTVTARRLQLRDPGCIVVDEIAAFWLVLWLLNAGSWTLALLAFALFRFFDAVKPGVVGWADRLSHQVDPQRDAKGWVKIGAGIMFDDYVAAGCSLLVVWALQWAVQQAGVMQGLGAYLL